MVEIFSMDVKEPHTAKRKLKLPNRSKINEVPQNQVFRVSDNGKTWNCHIESSTATGQHHLHVEPWNDFESRIKGRTISLRKEDRSDPEDPSDPNATPYKFEIQ
ncbi:hypothetical protein SLEP1_g33427 [Rubroshorea leprosula]|uniref:Uncharacterized protein n=1 Tax=Rubroshorea leprosula TaxID=152421 RepID=A0AAV5KGK7_9ROSI|nr:hypothetical protein SLEP1_g33427 [Rubroshorea leprosula]